MNNAFNATMDSGRRLQMGAEVMLDLAEFAKGYQRRLAKLERAHTDGDRKAVKHLTGTILKSFGAKLCVLVRSMKLQEGEVLPTFLKLKERANDLNPYRPVPEIVTTWLEPKIVGGCRQLVSFGWQRRALQLMCADILSIAYPVAPFDYSARGQGGVTAATVSLHKLIEEGDYKYVVTVDIKDCFGSAIKNKVGELLPLPETVVNNVLLIQDDVKVVVKPDKGTWTGHLVPSMLSTTHAVATDEAARRGVPQGSSASGIIMYKAVIGPLLRTLPFADRLVLIGDDLAVPVKDKLEGEAVLKALKSHYAASPVGLLTIGRHSISHIEAGFDFTSYRTTRKPTHWGGHLHSRPAPRSYRRFEHRAVNVFHKAGRGLAGWKEVILYTKRWMASFSLWTPNYLSKLYLWYTLKAGSWH